MSKNTKPSSKAPAKTNAKPAAKAAAQTPAKKNGSPMIALIIVLIAAIGLGGWFFAESRNVTAERDELLNQVDTIDAELKQTIAAKEAVEKELATAQEELDEAKLTLEESTARVAELETELGNLQVQNTANAEKIAELTAQLNEAKAVKENAEAHVTQALASLQYALDQLNGTTPEEPAVEEPAVEEPAVEEPAVEEPAVEEPAVEEPAVEEPAVEEPVVEEPAVEEPAVEEPAVEEPAVEEPAVEEPAVEETEQPKVTVNEDGSFTIETKTVIVTVALDENNAIATLTAVMDDAEVVDLITGQFIGKTLPVDAASIQLDAAGVAQAIIDALNVLVSNAPVNA